MDDATNRAVDAALLPMVASLGPWGVEEAHWLPDRAGAPVIWLRTQTRPQRRALEGQAWLVAQLQITLTRLGVPHAVVWSLRVEVTSAEDEMNLLDG